MRTLTRYFATLYAVNVVVLTVVLLSFVVGVDVFMNLKRFIDVAGEIEVAAGGAGGDGLRAVRSMGWMDHAVYTALVIGDLWGPRLLQLFNYLSGVILVAAMGFTCAQLSRHRELVAVMASGVSLRRAAVPFLLVGLAVTMVQAINQEAAIPSVAHLLVRDAGDAASARTSVGVPLTPDGAGLLLQAERFDPAAQRLERVSAWRRDAAGLVTEHIVAAGAAWDGAGWRLEGGVVRDRSSVPAVERPIERLETRLDPERIKVRHLQGFGGYLSWGQVSEVLRGGGLDERQRSALERARWGRVGMLLSNLMTLVAAMPFFLVRLPGAGVGAAVKALPVVALGLVAAAAAPVAAIPGLAAPVSAFVPSAILAPIAAALFSGMKT